MKDNNNKPKLPLAVFNHLDSSLLFNKFGIVNIGAVMASTGVKMDKKELKALIEEKFKDELMKLNSQTKI